MQCVLSVCCPPARGEAPACVHNRRCPPGRGGKEGLMHGKKRDWRNADYFVCPWKLGGICSFLKSFAVNSALGTDVSLH